MCGGGGGRGWAFGKGGGRGEGKEGEDYYVRDFGSIFGVVELLL